jgi:hypothetical protein
MPREMDGAGVRKMVNEEVQVVGLFGVEVVD